MLKLNAMKKVSHLLADGVTRATRQNARWSIIAAILKCAATRDEKLVAAPVPPILAGALPAVNLSPDARCVFNPTFVLVLLSGNVFFC